MGKRKRTAPVSSTAGSTDSAAARPSAPAPAPAMLGFPFRAGYMQRLSNTAPAKTTTAVVESTAAPGSQEKDSASSQSSSGKKKRPTSSPDNKAEEQAGGPTKEDAQSASEPKILVNIFTSKTNPRKALACAQAGSVMYLSGVCELTLLRGAVNVNGYKLKALERKKNVFAPVWGPAHRLHFSESKDKKKKKSSIKAALTQLKMSEEFNVAAAEASFECVLLLEGYDQSRLEWLLAAEDFSKYSSGTTAVYGESFSNYVSVQTAVLCDHASMALLGVDTMTVPKTWITAAAAVTADNKDPKIMLAGAKGVGKSTCLKYMINRYLSKLPAVCVIDCDLGQPEFNVPGMLALHFIDEPVLSASHVNMRKPDLSFYIGEITAKNEPSIVLAAIEMLFTRYNELLAQWKQKYKYPEASNSSSNGFSALEEQYVEKAPSLPLLVNTDGFIRYLGAEILDGIIRRVMPTHIVQIVSMKDKDIDPIRNYADACEGQDIDVHLHSIEAGRTSASRVTAVDLRSLRHSQYLKGGIPDSLSPGEADCADTVYVKSGGLVDPSCSIAKALLLSDVSSFPMSDVGLRLLPGESVPFALFPAVFNASVVGISRVHRTVVDTPCVHGLVDGKSVPLFQRKANGSVNRFHIKVNDRACCKLEPCDGLGVCRAVDTVNNLFHIIEPVPVCSNDTADESSTNTSAEQYLDRKVYLSKGSMQLPTIMTYVADLPYHPYLSGDSVGEGSSSMKGRSNVKRRAAGRNN